MNARQKCSLVFLVILLNGCSPVKSYFSDMVLQDNNLSLCEYHSGFERLNFASNSIEEIKTPQYFSCTHLLTAQNGWLWAYDDHSLNAYDGSKWRELQIPYQFDIGHVSETSDGAIWVSSGMLSRFDPARDRADIIVPAQPTLVSTPEPYTPDSTYTYTSPSLVGPVFEAADGALWFNEPKHGIVRWDQSANTSKTWDASIRGFDGIEPLPTKFIQTRDGSIWMGTLTGLYRFQDGAWQSIDGASMPEKEIGDYRVLDMLEDTRGKVWVAFKQAGVKLWDGSKWIELGYLMDDPIAIFQDSLGEVYIGFELRGAVKYQNGLISGYSTNIHTFLETPDHRLLGGGRDGLLIYNRQADQWLPYPVK